MRSGAERATSRPSPIDCSQRFRRAVLAERARLARRRGKLLERVTAQRRRLAMLEDEAEELGSRMAELEEVVERGEAVLTTPEVGSAVLSGRAIREVAVRVLLGRSPQSGAIHYRTWLALVCEAGYQVKGLRPDAVFFNQVTRSPLVKATQRAGMYEVDLEAPGRMRRRLCELQRALIGIAAELPADGEQLEAQAGRAQELSCEARLLRRRLEEALDCLGEEQRTAA